MTLNPLWRENLVHMLGAGSHIPKRQHGYRNYFCSSVGGKDYLVMLEMEVAGLVKYGKKINGSTCQYFYATEKGCEAIGLSKAAIRRAMER
jgi:hypothetical protein